MPDENYPVEDEIDINVSAIDEISITKKPAIDGVDIIFDGSDIFTTANYYENFDETTMRSIVVENPEPNEYLSTSSGSIESTTTSTTTTTPKKTSTTKTIEEIDQEEIETEANDTYSTDTSSTSSSSSSENDSSSCECSPESTSPCSCVSKNIPEPDPDHSAPELDCDILSGERCAPETTTELPAVETTIEYIETTTPDFFTVTEIICNSTEIEENEGTTVATLETTPETFIETTTEEIGPDFITVLDCNTTEASEALVTTAPFIDTTQPEIIETTVEVVLETTTIALETSYVTEIDCETIEPTESPDCDCADEECPINCPPNCETDDCSSEPDCENSSNCNREEPEEADSAPEHDCNSDCELTEITKPTKNPENGLDFELTTAEPLGPFVTYYDNQGPLVTTDGPPGPPKKPDTCVELWSEWSPCDCIDQRSMRSRERVCFCENCLEDLFEEEVCTEPCEVLLVLIFESLFICSGA